MIKSSKLHASQRVDKYVQCGGLVYGPTDQGCSLKSLKELVQKNSHTIVKLTCEMRMPAEMELTVDNKRLLCHAFAKCAGVEPTCIYSYMYMRIICAHVRVHMYMYMCMYTQVRRRGANVHSGPRLEIE